MLFRRSLLAVLLIPGIASCVPSNERADARPKPDAHITDYSCSGVPVPDTVPEIIKVAGTVFEPGIPGVTSNEPLEGVVIRAFEVGQNQELARAVSQEDGSFELLTSTEGVPKQAYLVATKSGYLETRLYPPRPVTADVEGFELPLFDPSKRSLLEERAEVDQDESLGLAIAGVVDCALFPVGQATVTTSPEVGSLMYQDSVGFPHPLIESTSHEGFVFMFNVPLGDLTVNATADGVDFFEVTVPISAIEGNIVYGIGIGP